MAFAVADFHDLVRLLEEHPDWRGDLRRLLLTDDILELPKIVRELAAAQERTEARLEQLAEAQQRTEARLEQLAEAQQRTEAQLAQLTARVDQLAMRMDQLSAATNRLVDVAVVVERDVGELKGIVLELRYRQHAGAYFARLLRRIRVLPAQQLADLVDDAEERELITEDDRLSLLATDVVLRGVRRDNRQETYFAVEVSWIIDGHDVERAAERAAILARLTGKPSLAVVAGRSMSDRAIERARELGVLQVLDGSTPAPELARDLRNG
jgi:hypothetical protein